MTSTLSVRPGLVLVVSLALFAAGCGGGGGNGASPSAADTPAPEVVRTVPANGETVSTTIIVSAYYSGALACEVPSRTGTFGDIVGTLSCNNVDGKGLIMLAPSAPLDPGRPYRWTVSGFLGANGKTALAHEGWFDTAALR